MTYSSMQMVRKTINSQPIVLGPVELAQRERCLKARARMRAPEVAQQSEGQAIAMRMLNRHGFLNYEGTATASLGFSGIAPQPKKPLWQEIELQAILERPECLLESIKIIIQEVILNHEIKQIDLLSRQRNRQFLLARQEAFWRLSQETSLSMVQIGRIFDRDHTTVIYGIRQFKRRAASGVPQCHHNTANWKSKMRETPGKTNKKALHLAKF